MKEAGSVNTPVTSKEAILKVCWDIVSEKGLPALNMRVVAKECNVALGSLYNYFSGKDDLVLAAIESVWQDIFHMERECRVDLSFSQYARWIFESVRRGMEEYPNFFTAHSISFASGAKNKARDTMEHYFGHMKIGMRKALDADAKVDQNAFSDEFTKSDFLDFVLSNILTLLMQHKSDCGMLLEVIRRTIY